MATVQIDVGLSLSKVGAFENDLCGAQVPSAPSAP